MAPIRSRHAPRRQASRAPLAAALALALLAAPSCGTDSGGGKPVVLLVTIDTLRADRLGCYGYEGAATPVMDGLAAGGVTFTAASTVVPLTLPSHASILTGRYPAATGVRNNGMHVLPEGETTLAEAFRAEGWTTGAFVGAFVLSAAFGLSQGFDVYDESFDRTRRSLTAAERTAASVNDAVFGWLDAERPDGPLFLWVHYFDPHARYEPPPPFDARFSDRPYDGEVAGVDRELGRLIERLEGRAGRNGLTVVVTSDHGEGLGEHDEATHGLFAYESTMRVPLILHAPGRLPEGRRVETPVSVVDVFDTVAALAGVGAPRGGPPRHGASLLPLAGGAGEDRTLPVLFESFLPRLEFGWSELRGVRDGPLKLIDAPRPELFDLSSDPGETENLAESRTGDVERLRGALGRSMATARASHAGDALQPADEEALERLRALGYVTAGTAAGAEGRAASDATGPELGLPDPKDRLDTYRRIKAAGEAVGQGPDQIAFAVETLADLLEENPDSVAVRWRYAEALLKADRPGDVVALLKPRLDAGEEFFWVPWLLAKAEAALDNREAALALYRDAQRRSPFFARRVLEVAVLLREMDRLEESVEEARRGLDATPGDAALLELIAANCRDLGRTGCAESHYRKVLEVRPEQGSAALALGTLLLQAGRDEDAAAVLERHVELEPGSAEGQRLLGLARMNTDELDAASRALERSLALTPGHPETLYYLLQCQIERGATDEADETAGRLLEAAPDAHHTHRAIGRLRARQGRTEAARAAYRKALEIEPGDAAARDALARLEKPAGDGGT